MEGRVKTKVRKETSKENIVTNIRGLRSFEAARVWSALEVEGVTNRQRDVAWLALHDVLLTKEFLKGLDIISSERCPRDGCGWAEHVKHVLWDCEYAKEVRMCFEVFVDKICKLSYVNLLTSVGLGKVEGKCSGWIFCFVIKKEVLWDMRNQLVVRKEELEVRWCCKMILMKLHTAFLYHVRRLGEDVSRRIWRSFWSDFVKVGVG